MRLHIEFRHANGRYTHVLAESGLAEIHPNADIRLSRPSCLKWGGLQTGS
tara:strand:- start:4485 stop:4634 length:150 start_codon:yes stop_codon:yes gene_type:complete